MDDEPGTGTFDLSLLARDLAAAGRHAGVVKMIGQVAAVGSAHKDLGDARTALELLRPLTDGREGGEPGDLRRDGPVGAALFAHAVILYARATETKAIDRVGWFGVGKLAEPSREWHREVMLYRNRVLAHFGKGLDHAEGPSVREALTYAVVRNGARRQVRVNFYDARAQTRAVLQAKLETLLEETIPLSRSVYDKRSAALVDELGRVASYDRSLADWVRRHPFDGEAFFGGEVGPEDILAAGGTASYALVEGSGGPAVPGGADGA